MHWTFSAATLQILFMLKQQHYTLTNVKKVKSQSTTPLIHRAVVHRQATHISTDISPSIWTRYCVACQWFTALCIKCCSIENRWWRLTANQETALLRRCACISHEIYRPTLVQLCICQNFNIGAPQLISVFSIWCNKFFETNFVICVRLFSKQHYVFMSPSIAEKRFILCELKSLYKLYEVAFICMHVYSHTLIFILVMTAESRRVS